MGARFLNPGLSRLGLSSFEILIVTGGYVDSMQKLSSSSAALLF